MQPDRGAARLTCAGGLSSSIILLVDPLVAPLTKPLLFFSNNPAPSDMLDAILKKYCTREAWWPPTKGCVIGCTPDCLCLQEV